MKDGSKEHDGDSQSTRCYMCNLLQQVARVSPLVTSLNFSCLPCMQRRGEIVFRDLRSSSSWTSFHLFAAFFAGLATLIAFLEFCIATDMLDNRVGDPPLQPDESSDSDDLHGAPPTPWSGVVLNLLQNMTVKQMVIQYFHLEVDTPGLVRVLNDSTPIDWRTMIIGLEWPRRLFVQVSSYTEYQRCILYFGQLEHAPILTPHEQRAQGTLPTRVHIHFVSVFRALQQYDNLITAQSVVINRLEDRLARLEQAVSTGAPLVLTPKQKPPTFVWFPSSPDESQQSQPPEEVD